jgi:hypothetical protein
MLEGTRKTTALQKSFAIMHRTMRTLVEQAASPANPNSPRRLLYGVDVTWAVISAKAGGIINMS